MTMERINLPGTDVRDLPGGPRDLGDRRLDVGRHR